MNMTWKGNKITRISMYYWNKGCIGTVGVYLRLLQLVLNYVSKLWKALWDNFKCKIEKIGENIQYENGYWIQKTYTDVHQFLTFFVPHRKIKVFTFSVYILLVYYNSGDISHQFYIYYWPE